MCPLPRRSESDPNTVAEIVLENTKKIGVTTTLKACNICNSINAAILLSAQLFTFCATGAHQVFREEKALSNYITTLLSKDCIAQRRLPMTAEDIFWKLSDGVILARLVMRFNNHIMDVGQFDPSDDLTHDRKLNNARIVLDGISNLGCSIGDIEAQDIVEGRLVDFIGFLQLKGSNLMFYFAASSDQTLWCSWCMKS